MLLLKMGNLLKKPGLELVTSNYRPVSNRPFLSKVLEQCCLVQFNAHCSRYKLLPDYQSAYRENYSCETALIKLTDDLLNAMEHQKVTALVAIDLSAAFDTVDHSILLSVFSKKFGVAGSALKWFETYLYPRACKVNVVNFYSEVKDLNFSVPQGSCYGPFLYLAYASTIQEVVPNDISLHGFADDHALKRCFEAGNSHQELTVMQSFENCLNKGC